jgi:DNA mismatch endonuclease (patch repair protein)
MMAGIGPANTKPEMLIRRGLHALGWRYRLHDRKLPGRPDLVFPGRRAVIFVNGCFWHGHDCHLFKWPKSREQFWRDKISGNIDRDRWVRDELQAFGWRVADVRECTLKGRERLPLDEVLGRLDAFLRSEADYCSIGADSAVSLPPAGDDSN